MNNSIVECWDCGDLVDIDKAEISSTDEWGQNEYVCHNCKVTFETFPDWLYEDELEDDHLEDIEEDNCND